MELVQKNADDALGEAAQIGKLSEGRLSRGAKSHALFGRGNLLPGKHMGADDGAIGWCPDTKAKPVGERALVWKNRAESVAESSKPTRTNLAAALVVRTWGEG
jgi:hypothetical protein